MKTLLALCAAEAAVIMTSLVAPGVVDEGWKTAAILIIVLILAFAMMVWVCRPKK